MLLNGDELPCEARAVTVERAEIAVRARPEVGETVICFLDNVGLLRGSVTARLRDGFALRLEIPAEHRDRIRGRLEWHAARASEAVEHRAAPRIVPVQKAVEVRLGEALAVPARIIDLSLSGAAIAIDARVRPYVGSVVRVGRRFATVVRMLDNGIAVQFREPFAREAFSELVVL